MGRVDRIAALVALDVTPAQNEDRQARKLPPISELNSLFSTALAIRQVPTRLGKRPEYGRQTYLLNFSVFVSETVPKTMARHLIDSIEKVTYVLDKRWFRPNTNTRTNRDNNFQYAVTVWGTTRVKAKAEFLQAVPPVCWSGFMNFDNTIKLNPAECGEDS